MGSVARHWHVARERTVDGDEGGIHGCVWMQRR